MHVGICFYLYIFMYVRFFFFFFHNKFSVSVSIFIESAWCINVSLITGESSLTVAVANPVTGWNIIIAM